MTPQEINRFMLNRLLDASVMTMATMNTHSLLTATLKQALPLVNDVKVQAEIKKTLEDALKQHATAQTFAKQLVEDLQRLKQQLS
jgi:hypothetical protein